MHCRARPGHVISRRPAPTSVIHTNSLALSLSLSRSPFLSRSLFLSLSLSLSLSHTHTLSLSLSLSHDLDLDMPLRSCTQGQLLPITPSTPLNTPVNNPNIQRGRVWVLSLLKGNREEAKPPLPCPSSLPPFKKERDRGRQEGKELGRKRGGGGGRVFVDNQRMNLGR